MTDRNLTPRRHPAADVSRRSLVAGLHGGGLALTRFRPAALARQATPAATELDPPRGPTFVGPTSDPETLAAVVFLDADPGEVVAYLCQGPELNIWFTGRLADDMLDLTGPEPTAAGSEPAPTLTGQLSPDGITGEAHLPDRTLTFEAIPAAGIAGLYDTMRDAAGVVRGAASTGATLEAQQVAAEGESADEAPYRIVGTVTLPNGEQVALEIPAHTEDAAAFRWIALANHEVKGARRLDPDGGDENDELLGI